MTNFFFKILYDYFEHIEFQKGSQTMKKLLIVVDYQKDFVNGSLGFDGAEKLDILIADKIRSYRENGDDVVFTADTHDSDYLFTQEGKKLPVVHCVKNTDGWQLYGTVATLFGNGDKLFKKSVFGSGDLYEWLKTTEYDSVELVGLVSNICVISNAVLVKTALPEAEVTVDASCTASADMHLHDSALDVMAGLQIKITNRQFAFTEQEERL